MHIRFACRNGHVLKAHIRNAGRKTHCPRCQVAVWVPQPKPVLQMDEGLTDTQAVRLLGSYHPSQRNLLAAPAPTPSNEDRECPKCRQLVPALCRICPSCNTYLGSLTEGER
ncbi:MAG: hypothetical protein MUF48_02355 [Pirellulaceae bacterium]|jgi:hypothetical protein|nr:hypothetical protein [Pirellulaceae bacterium]